MATWESARPARGTPRLVEVGGRRGARSHVTCVTDRQRRRPPRPSCSRGRSARMAAVLVTGAPGRSLESSLLESAHRSPHSPLLIGASLPHPPPARLLVGVIRSVRKSRALASPLSRANWNCWPGRNKTAFIFLSTCSSSLSLTLQSTYYQMAEDPLWS